MSTVSERREEMYQKSIRCIKDAIAYAQTVLNDQHESSLYCSAVEKNVKVPSADPGTLVAEIGEQFTVVFCPDGVGEVDDSFSKLKKELAHAYARHDVSLWGINLKI